MPGLAMCIAISRSFFVSATRLACRHNACCSIIVITITCFSCLEARCVSRQAAVKAAKILPLVGLAGSKQDPVNRGHGAQSYTAPRQPGPLLFALCKLQEGSITLTAWKKDLVTRCLLHRKDLRVISLQ